MSTLALTPGRGWREPLPRLRLGPVQVYVDLADWWAGVYAPLPTVYIVAFAVVVRLDLRAKTTAAPAPEGSHHA